MNSFSTKSSCAKLRRRVLGLLATKIWFDRMDFPRFAKPEEKRSKNSFHSLRNYSLWALWSTAMKTEAVPCKCSCRRRLDLLPYEGVRASTQKTQRSARRILARSPRHWQKSSWALPLHFSFLSVLLLFLGAIQKLNSKEWPFHASSSNARIQKSRLLTLILAIRYTQLPVSDLGHRKGRATLPCLAFSVCVNSVGEDFKRPSWCLLWEAFFHLIVQPFECELLKSLPFNSLTLY